jgi:hypothetical protein
LRVSRLRLEIRARQQDGIQRGVHVHPSARVILRLRQDRKRSVDALPGFRRPMQAAQCIGALDADGAGAGPAASTTNTGPAFYVGINDPLGGNPRNLPFTSVIFNYFEGWSGGHGRKGAERSAAARMRASIVRGRDLFNSKPINITGVGGLNDDLNAAIIPGTDPGRALVTGLWSDVGKVKGPVLRGVAARAPYFHNGSAASLSDVIEFYTTSAST